MVGLAADQPGVKPEAAINKADAYYHYTLGHLYEELAGAYGNRSDFVTQAVDNYRLAMKEDPKAGFLVNDIAQLYIAAGMIPEAIHEAETALKANPDDLDAHRVLANVYRRQSADPQTNRLDDAMARRAVEQYQFIISKDPKDVDSLIMLGNLQKILGNSVDAETAFKQVLNVEPDNEEAISGLANVYSDRGNPAAGAQLLEKLNDKDASPRTLELLANEYEQMHQYDKAADAYKRAVDLDPSRAAELQAAMAEDLTLAGQYDDALKAYQSVASANTESAEPYIGMARVYRQQHKWNDAQSALDKAKTVEPDSLDVQYNEILLLQDQGKLPEAIAGMKSLITKTSKPGSPTSGEKAANIEMQDRLANLYRQNQQYDLAVDTYRQIPTINADLTPKVEYQIIETYRIAKNYPKAMQESDAASAKYPSDRLLSEARSEVLGDEGKTDESVAVLRKELNGSPADREVYVDIAQRYLAGKNYPETAKALDQADKLSTGKDDKETVLFLRGSMYERQKQYDLAEQAFRQVLADDPENASALNYLGYMLADRGVRLPEAQEFIQRAVRLDPNNYAFLDSLGWVYYHENKLEDAEQQLRHSLQISADDPTIHDHLGDVYSKEGKLKEAIDQWQASLKAYSSTATTDFEPEDVTKVQRKLDSARVRLAEMK